MTGPFERYADRDVVELIERNPLAWLVNCDGGYSATPMPMLLETDRLGRPNLLIGHIPKAQPLYARMVAQPRTLFLFSGPHDYISPEYVATTREWGPTWNFAVVKIVADVEFDEDYTHEALRRLVDHMERGRERPWKTDELGPRYEQLTQRIIGFRAEIRSVEARFKLGQDERPEVFSSILSHLGDSELAEWMTRFAKRRD